MNTSNQTYKELAIPYFKETFDSIDEVMNDLEIPYYLIGVSAISLALLKKDIKPSRGTKDIDFAVMVSNNREYEAIGTALQLRGFNKTENPWRYYSPTFNVAIDILPFGEIEQNHTVSFNERKTDLHVLGFREVLEEAEEVKIEEKIVNIPPLPGMVILKLIAWSDRPEHRVDDLSDILRIIEHFYRLAWDEIVEEHFDTLDSDPFDEKLIAAEVLGRKTRVYLQKSESISARVTQILASNLMDVTKSTIAIDWAKRLDSDVEYAFSILSAFKKGILH